MKIWRVFLDDGQSIDLIGDTVSIVIDDALGYLQGQNPESQISELIISKVELLSEPIEFEDEEPEQSDADISDTLSPEQAAL